MTRRAQRQVMRRVLQTYTKTVDLETALRLRGETELATEVGRRADALGREVDRLRREMWRAWSGGAARLEETLRRRNARLQAAIRDVERDVRTADRVAGALEIVTEVIGFLRVVGVA